MDEHYRACISPVELADAERNGIYVCFAIEMVIWWVSERIDSWLQQTINLARTDSILPKKTSGDMNEPSLLCIGPAELAVTARRSIVIFLVVDKSNSSGP